MLEAINEQAFHLMVRNHANHRRDQKNHYALLAFQIGVRSFLEGPKVLLKSYCRGILLNPNCPTI